MRCGGVYKHGYLLKHSFFNFFKPVVVCVKNIRSVVYVIGCRVSLAPGQFNQQFKVGQKHRIVRTLRRKPCEFGAFSVKYLAHILRQRSRFGFFVESINICFRSILSEQLFAQGFVLLVKKRVSLLF